MDINTIPSPHPTFDDTDNQSESIRRCKGNEV